MTRAIVSMERAATLDGPVIFAIGNAPTALIRLYEMMQKDEIHPDFIIGTPVGFVNVVESKELICQSSVPCIVARGRKGGSNIAAAVCNALMYQVTRRRNRSNSLKLSLRDVMLAFSDKKFYNVLIYYLQKGGFFYGE